MRTKNLILAAVVAAGGLCFVPGQASAQDATQRPPNALERAGNAVERTADRLTGASTNPADSLAPDAEDIRQTLKTATQASVTKSGFDDLIERFVDADRVRLGKDGFAEKDHPTLDGRIAQLQKDWMAKYNQEFAIKDKDAVYSAVFASIIQSEVPGTARLAGDRQVNSTSDRPANMTMPPPADAQQTRDVAKDQRDAGKIAGGDTNLNPGRNIATVQVAASHGLPALSVPMIHEFPDVWKIDVPDNFSAQQLHDNLLKHLTMVNDMKAEWPADVNDAYRAVTHHILMAVLNVDQNSPNMPNMPMNNANRNMNGAGMTNPPAAGTR